MTSNDVPVEKDPSDAGRELLDQSTEITRMRFQSRRFLLAVIATLALVTWRSMRQGVTIAKTSTQTVVMDVPFERFRKILVRKNAARELIRHSGMELVDQEIEQVELEANIPRTGRPIRDLISEFKDLKLDDFELDAGTKLVVRPNDEFLGDETLELQQVAKVQPDSMTSVTNTIQPAKQLRDYSTQLSARTLDGQTEVVLNVAIEVRLNLPFFLWPIAGGRVQEAADQSVTQQLAALSEFIDQHKDALIVLPEF